MSRFAGMKEMVASPGRLPGVEAEIWKRTMELGLQSEYMGSAWTWAGLKYFQPLIFFAAAGCARMTVWRNAGSNCRRVASWQWSDLSCEMRTRCGGGISDRWLTQDGTVLRARANLEWKMVESLASSQGSTRTVNVPGLGAYPARVGSDSAEAKVKRKVLSPFKCFTFNDMLMVDSD